MQQLELREGGIIHPWTYSISTFIFPKQYSIRTQTNRGIHLWDPKICTILTDKCLI